MSLAESKLKDDIIPLLDALGTNESLKELDIRLENACLYITDGIVDIFKVSIWPVGFLQF